MVKIKGNRELNNAAWIIGEQVFQMAISFFIMILSARYLGPSNYGLINYTASFVTFTTSVVTLGMDGVVIKKMVDFPDREGEYLGSCMAFRLVSAFVCGAGSIAVVWMLNPGDNLMLMLVAVQSVQLIFKAVSVLDSWFQRHLKAKYVSLAKMLSCIIVAAYRIYLLVTRKSVVWFAFSSTLTMLVIAVVLVISYQKNKNSRLKVSVKCGFDVLKDSYHFIISGLMTAIYGQMDKIMLGGMISSASVGFYTTAASLCSMWLFVPLAVINSLRPGILEQKSRGNEQLYMFKLQKLYSIIIWICMIVSIGVFVFGGFAIRILYGEAYSGAIRPLKILIWSETFAMIGSARGAWILAENKNKYVKYYLGMGAALNLLLNSTLIPVYGAEGAAVATLITQIFTSMIAPLLFKGTREHTRIVLQSVNFIRFLRS